MNDFFTVKNWVSQCACVGVMLIEFTGKRAGSEPIYFCILCACFGSILKDVNRELGLGWFFKRWELPAKELHTYVCGGGVAGGFPTAPGETPIPSIFEWPAPQIGWVTILSPHPSQVLHNGRRVMTLTAVNPIALIKLITNLGELYFVHCLRFDWVFLLLLNL